MHEQRFAHDLFRVRLRRGLQHGALFFLLLAPALARAEPDRENAARSERHMLEQRRDDLKLEGHVFVAPLALRSVPFEFAIPVAQIASYTQIEAARVSGARNLELGPVTALYALAAQTYQLSARIVKRLEVSVSPLGEAAAGLSADSIVAGGASASGGGNAAIAYRLIPFDKFAATVRVGGHFEWGYNANIEPLLYLAGTNPLAFTGGLNAVTARIGYPTREIGGSIGLSMAMVLLKGWLVQAFVRGDAVSSRTSPFLQMSGKEAAGSRELTYEAWNWSLGASAGVYLSDEVLLQPQIGVAHHSNKLSSPAADRGPYASDTYVVPAVQIMVLPSPVLQLGVGLGTEIATSEQTDVYQNHFNTRLMSGFVQLVARYVWGQSWFDK